MNFTSLRPLESLADRPGDTPGGSLEFPITLSVAPSGAESEAESDGPGTALEQKDREDDSEPGTEGRLDDKVREALVPLFEMLARHLTADRTEFGRTFSLRRSSEAGRCVFCWMISEVVAVMVFCSNGGRLAIYGIGTRGRMCVLTDRRGVFVEAAVLGLGFEVGSLDFG
jgi:hypothetical protein